MPFFDLSLTELHSFKPNVTEPSDFDDFWKTTLAMSRGKAVPAIFTKVSLGVKEYETFDVTFSGFNGDPIKAWYVTRKGSNPETIVVEYIGYGGGRGFPHERLAWVSAGFSYFFMDTRGQGSNWGSGGQTADPFGSQPHSPGSMTMGITNKNDYFYRRVFTDAVLAIDAVRESELISAESVVVTGVSQGGGIAIAVAGLVENLSAALPDVPFLQNFEGAVGMTSADPYQEIVRYLSVHRDQIEQAFTTLSYFEGVNFAKRATAPALFSTALMDEICPPSTVFASRNHYQGKADIEVYRFNGHEGGQGHHFLKQITWLKQILDKRSISN